MVNFFSINFQHSKFLWALFEKVTSLASGYGIAGLKWLDYAYNCTTDAQEKKTRIIKQAEYLESWWIAGQIYMYKPLVDTLHCNFYFQDGASICNHKITTVSTEVVEYASCTFAGG